MLLDFILSPFKRYIHLFILIFILFSATSIYLHTSVYHVYPYAIYLASHGYLLAYITILFLSLFPKYLKGIITIFIIITALLFFILDFYCIFHLRTPFDADFATLLMATNINEANEFIQTMVPFSFIAIIICSFILIGLIYYTFKRFCKFNRKIALIPFFFVLISGYAFYHNPLVYKHGIIGKIIAITSYEIPNNLKDFFVHPRLTTINQSPKNIVVIMGESHSKHHSSLYGYNKNTNPMLGELSKDSSLYLFTNVTSAGLTTMRSFTKMMSSYGSGQKYPNKKWYEHILINDVLKQANYQTHWFSNHANAGVNNNVTRLLAEACDDNHFWGNQLASDFRTYYDEGVIKLARPLIPEYDKNNQNFYLFHLMGSHFKFDLRYPKEFSKFNESDYLDKLKHQRSTLAAYDNSILYNDSIVYEIIQLFKDKEAIIIYLSDHGLDVYKSSDYYAAHGIHNNPISAKYGYEIPFLIYATERYQEKYPYMIRRISNNLNKPFRTDILMYLLMDLMGVKFSDNNDVEIYSPL